ncbi:Endonuclease/exonuclease/phosphatase [Mycena polygramma]|nr:Endonuclease/exonuclease/phosphatase [Mycena polygramma]
MSKRLTLSKFWTALFRQSSMPSKTATSTKSAAKESPNNLYYYDARIGKRRWVPTTSDTSEPFQPTEAPFSLLSWNVDFSAPLVVRRFQAVLTHLEQLLSPHLTSPSPGPTIILLQEIHNSCFQSLLANAFIREFYKLTNVTSRQSYSTVTLVPKSLAVLVSSVSRIPFPETRMQRDCLYVDLDIPLPESTSETKVLRLRIANTHLESLSGFGDTAKPKQLAVIGKLLTAAKVDGGLVAGDMNCISPSDQNTPEEVGLSDAWLATTARPAESGAEDVVDEADTGEAEGHTWGYQPKCEYPPRRLDKILTVGKLKAVDIRRVGVGLKLEDRDAWVSDHYGLLAKIVLCP